MTTIVFIHGRGQEGKDPKVLLGEWCNALCAGLGVTGLGSEAVLPYYGNVLHRATAAAAKRADPADQMPADGAEEVPFHQDYLRHRTVATPIDRACH
ncbi:hypothetical protein [Nonomuraea solani]|nr:hypothetical protein [Nonomuraea solani]